MRHGDDQLAFLFGNLLEQFLLQKLDVHDGEGVRLLDSGQNQKRDSGHGTDGCHDRGEHAAPSGDRDRERGGHEAD